MRKGLSTTTVRFNAAIVALICALVVLVGCQAFKQDVAPEESPATALRVEEPAYDDASTALPEDGSRSLPVSETKEPNSPTEQNRNLFETDFYTIDCAALPEGSAIEYDAPYLDTGNGLWVGCASTVWQEDGSMLFQVVCFSTNWGPQGTFATKKVGVSPDAAGGGATVFVLCGFDPADSGAHAEAQGIVDQYGSCVAMR